ncbi:MCE family protein [Nocardioides alcanivorans]|uniref:MCE family protein n=1 Tax=Nocardioides alcanivorans TaxID=2897352 RepID=UPI001F445A61|nr:MlaD family protein [Nocardioides alcanivorans]
MKISPLVGLTAKSLVFTIVTVLATAALGATILNSKGDANREFTAIFTDATSLNKGDDVRMSGVRVGTVSGVEVRNDSEAEVTFTVSDDVPMEQGTSVELRFRNLVGQRYVSLEPPAQAAPALEEGHTFELGETRPALDLTVLFNGFQPLLRMLDAKDINALSGQIIAVFQGEDATVEGLLRSTASLTSTLADRDQVIGDLIGSLSTVLETIDTRSDDLSTTLTTMQQLVSGLAEDREVIGSTLDGLGDLTDSVSTLLADTRKPLKGNIDALGQLSGNLADSEDVLDTFFTTLPVKFDRIGRTASYGSWINFYLCSIEGRIPMPEGYMGDLGVKPVAGRCR